MKRPPQAAWFDFSLPLSRERLEQGLRLWEDSFADQRQRAEQLTRELIAGTVTPARLSEVTREAYEQTWKSYATWLSLMDRPPRHAEADDDTAEYNSDERDE
jgi:hypothetical protein